MDPKQQCKKVLKIPCRHDSYGQNYLISVLMCLINLMIQVSATDWFLNGNFFSYGFVYNYRDQGRGTTDTQDVIFPKMSK